MTLKFWQIYFKDEQLQHLYPFATPYKNLTLTPYFENSVIAELVPKATADYVGVASWRLKQKRGEGPSETILRRNGTLELTEEKILQSDFDIAILTPRNHKDIREKFILWHAPYGAEALAEFSKFIKIPDVVDHAIYENHFIARREIYQDYVENCLKSAIEFIGQNEIMFYDSGYISKKRNQQEIEAYQKESGRKDWPLAPFVLERLFSIWSSGKGLKVINL